MAPIVCPRTWAENGDAAVTATATAVRMIYYSRHTREGKKTKNTPRSIVTPIVCPRTWAENGDVAVTTTAVCTSTTTHRRRSQKNTPRVDCDTEPTTSYLQQRELGLLIFIEEPRFCGHAPLCAVKTLLYVSAALSLSAVDRRVMSV